MSGSNLWFLENIDAQGIFCPQKMSASGASHVITTVRKGEFIFLPQDAADKIYFIATGRVKISADGNGDKSVTKAILGPGEIFGELAVAGQDVRRDAALALEDTELCIMTKDQMTKMFKDHNPLSLFIMNLIGNRALRMERRLESLVFKDSRSRIIDFLVDLNASKGQRVGYEWVVRRFYTHQEIANLTATSRQTVTTVLNELKSRDLLTFNRKRLLIRNLEKLKAEVAYTD